MADLLENLNCYVQKYVNVPLTHRQCERVRWALDFTEEALLACGVPQDLREKELAAVAAELVEEFNRPDYPYGEPRYPNAATELVWTKRAQNHWQYDPALQLRAPRVEDGQDSSRSGAGLGKGNGQGNSAAPCPYDTDGDGNCGRPLCAYCGPLSGRRS